MADTHPTPLTLAHDWPPRLPEAAKRRVLEILAVGCAGWQCPGGTASLVRRQTSNAVWTIRMQCNACGRGLGGGPMKRDLHPNWPDYPEWATGFEEAREAQRDEYLAARAEQSEAWWDHYEVYLLNPVWRAKRERVMRRANWTCEGCGERQATQVHHRQYPRGRLPGSREWIAEEKLFDLVAVCERCHNDLHPR